MSYSVSAWMTLQGNPRDLFSHHAVWRDSNWFNFPALNNMSTADLADDDEVEFVRGLENELPHLRSNCSSHPFSKSPKPSNFAYCTRCFCYLCDTTVSTCADWISHCHASSGSSCWNKAQKLFAAGRKSGKPNSEIDAELMQRYARRTDTECIDHLPNVMWTGCGADRSWGAPRITTTGASRLFSLITCFEYGISNSSCR